MKEPRAKSQEPRAKSIVNTKAKFPITKEAVIIICTAVVFYFMNFFTPKIADDYAYSDRVQSLADILPDIFTYYTAGPGHVFVGGRVVAVFLIDFFALVGKPFFNAANALAYIALVLLMYFHSTGTLRKINILLYGAINICVWYLVPEWGENFLWMTGSCFYVWPVIIILFFLAPLRKKTIDKTYRLTFPQSILYLILGIASGLSYENATAAVFFVLLAYCVIKILYKEKFVLFEILGMSSFLIGFILLLAAPGNYVRMNSFEITHQYGFFQRLAMRLYETTQVFIINHGALLAGASGILALELFFHQKKNIALFSWLFLLAGIAGTFSMILSPLFLGRVFFPVTIFLVISFFSFFCQIEWPLMLKRNIKSFTAVALLLFAFSFLKAEITIIKLYTGNEHYNILEKHYGYMHGTCPELGRCVP